jgi:hypothetical protein
MTVTSILLQRISPLLDTQVSYTYDKYQLLTTSDLRVFF